jgi:hypothetical protein
MYMIPLCSVNWKGQPAADRCGATIFKLHVFSYELLSTGLGSIFFADFLRPYIGRQNTFLKYVRTVCLSFLVHDLSHPSISCFVILNVRVCTEPQDEISNSVLNLCSLICLEERGFFDDTFILNKQFG